MVYRKITNTKKGEADTERTPTQLEQVAEVRQDLLARRGKANRKNSSGAKAPHNTQPVD